MQNANTNKIGFRVAENLLCPAVGSSVQERDLEQVQQRELKVIGDWSISYEEMRELGLF